MFVKERNRALGKEKRGVLGKGRRQVRLQKPWRCRLAWTQGKKGKEICACGEEQWNPSDIERKRSQWGEGKKRRAEYQGSGKVRLGKGNTSSPLRYLADKNDQEWGIEEKERGGGESG